MTFFEKETKSALQAKLEAQRIAFGPVIFQASKVMRDLGILTAIDESGEKGLNLETIIEKTGLPLYGVRVLIEAGLGIGLIYSNDNQFILSKTGYFILHDEMTRVNMDFTHDVNYLGTFHMEEAITKGTPAGLKVFGEWKTVYQALAHLPKNVQNSWFNFDHYYSDQAFPQCLPLIFKNDPKKILDVGGNTGKWSFMCTNYSPTVQMTIADLPSQSAMALENIKNKGLENRIHLYQTDVLNPENELPTGHDIIWMSQFLDCFSEDEIVLILKKAHKAMDNNGTLCILETYWDRQRYEAAAFCLQQTSLYFTCIANGNSQMYHSENMIICVEKAGFIIEEDIDHIGVSHTLFKCKKK